jgi:hypothetical protein
VEPSEPGPDGEPEEDATGPPVGTGLPESYMLNRIAPPPRFSPARASDGARATRRDEAKAIRPTGAPLASSSREALMAMDLLRQQLREQRQAAEVKIEFLTEELGRLRERLRASLEENRRLRGAPPASPSSATAHAASAHAEPLGEAAPAPRKKRRRRSGRGSAEARKKLATLGIEIE